MSKTGDKPGKGTYVCKKCGHTIILNKDTEELPKCPVCGHDEFTP